MLYFIIWLSEMFYLYRFLDCDNNIIYVGKTKRALHYRFAQHEHLPESCYSKVTKIEYLICETEADMSMKEIYYINKYRMNGHAEYNVSDVSTLPQEVDIKDKEDKWISYVGRLPSTFANSINYLEGYGKEKKDHVKRNDGRIIKFHQNSITGKEKFVYPIMLSDIERLIVYFVESSIYARSKLYAFYNIRNIVILILGISTAMRKTELISLRICDLYESDGKIKPFVFQSGGKTYSLNYPERVIWLLTEYYRIIKERFNKENNYWLFWGKQDNGNSISQDAFAKTLNKASKYLNIPTNISVESLRKTFFRYIIDVSDNKYEAIDCLTYYLDNSSRHTAGRMLKYIDVLDHNIEIDPITYVEDKMIVDAISEECFDMIKLAISKLNKNW